MLRRLLWFLLIAPPVGFATAVYGLALYDGVGPERALEAIAARISQSAVGGYILLVMALACAALVSATLRAVAGAVRYARQNARTRRRAMTLGFSVAVSAAALAATPFLLFGEQWFGTAARPIFIGAFIAFSALVALGLFFITSVDSRYATRFFKGETAAEGAYVIYLRPFSPRPARPRVSPPVAAAGALARRRSSWSEPPFVSRAAHQLRASNLRRAAARCGRAEDWRRRWGLVGRGPGDVVRMRNGSISCAPARRTPR